MSPIAKTTLGRRHPAPLLSGMAYHHIPRLLALALPLILEAGLGRCRAKAMLTSRNSNVVMTPRTLCIDLNLRNTLTALCLCMRTLEKGKTITRTNLVWKVSLRRPLIYGCSLCETCRCIGS